MKTIGRTGIASFFVLHTVVATGICFFASIEKESTVGIVVSLIAIVVFGFLLIFLPFRKNLTMAIISYKFKELGWLMFYLFFTGASLGLGLLLFLFWMFFLAFLNIDMDWGIAFTFVYVSLTTVEGFLDARVVEESPENRWHWAGRIEEPVQ